MAFFSEMCAPRIHVSETGFITPNLPEERIIFWLHFSIFALEK